MQINYIRDEKRNSPSSKQPKEGWTETDIEMVFKDEDDSNVFHRFPIKDITAAAAANVNKLLME